MHASQMLMRSIAVGQVKVTLEYSFPLAEAAAAHRAIEGNKTRGKVVLTV